MKFLSVDDAVATFLDEETVLLERQFRGVYERALKRRGVTGEQMLQILETRLDNVAYHLGFANTRAAALAMYSLEGLPRPVGLYPPRRSRSRMQARWASRSPGPALARTASATRSVRDR